MEFVEFDLVGVASGKATVNAKDIRDVVACGGDLQGRACRLLLATSHPMIVMGDYATITALVRTGGGLGA